ncbi:MAG: hypothetical protein U1F15_03940 [Burkholderiales bacterium]
MNGPGEDFDKHPDDSARGNPAGVRCELPANGAARRSPQGAIALGRPGRSSFWSRRTLMHGIGLLLALAVAWLILMAYRRPDFVIDLTNLSLC